MAKRGCKINTDGPRHVLPPVASWKSIWIARAIWIDDKFSTLIWDESCAFETLGENWMQNSTDKTECYTYLFATSISLHIWFLKFMIQRKCDDSRKLMRAILFQSCHYYRWFLSVEVTLHSLPFSLVPCPSMLQQSNDPHMEMTCARNTAKKY